MNEREKQEIIRRLTRRFAPDSVRGASSGHGPDTMPPRVSSGHAPQVAQRASSGHARDGAPRASSGHATEPVETSLNRLVEIGASRFGVRADVKTGFSACDLAPPLARMIDHTALKPETSLADIQALCDEANKYCFASVCVNPCYVARCSEQLKGTPVAICTVIGFPLGANRPEVKARETELALRDGATEVDMVLNVGMLKSAEYAVVERDIRAVVKAARSRRSVVVKVILETALLTGEEKVIACVLAQNAGADFVKTSTGFSKGGATAADIALMRQAVGKEMGVKASGGIRSTEDAEKMIAHGATRIGASASVAILKGLRAEGQY